MTVARRLNRFVDAAALALILLLTGCASEPVAHKTGDDTAYEASNIAAAMVGKPYRYGGNSPNGFDCSGLVYYSYRHAGLAVPRSTATQRARSHKISLSHLSRGDLLFFDQEGKYSSHVGIYLGDNRFVHAPSHGKRVRVDSLNERYWQKHLVDARRF